MARAQELMDELQDLLGGKLARITRLKANVVRAELLHSTDLANTAVSLRDKLGFNHCSLLTAVDHIDSFECVYHLSNTRRATMLELHVLVHKDEPSLASLAQVWEGVNWHEREAYDLMGIEFTGHPDPERILLPRDFQGHPLRKDYVYRIREEEW